MQGLTNLSYQVWRYSPAQIRLHDSVPSPFLEANQEGGGQIL